MRFVLLFLLTLFAMPVPVPVVAQSKNEAPFANVQLSDARAEAEAKALMEKVRCLVCQGQSIADSDSDMAGDMRSLIRERIAKGETPESIMSWLIERYGDTISYAPPVSQTTALLWAAPIVLLIIGGFFASGRFRRRKA
jgi:cytochrome c-type biogenesis protein CcmH